MKRPARLSMYLDYRLHLFNLQPPKLSRGTKRKPSDSIIRAGPIVVGLVPPGQQSAGDDLCLDFRRPLKNVEDARIVEHAADRGLDRIADAAVDLHGIVGI